MADDPATEAPEPVPCSPCRGTGQVVSNLGGSPSTTDCPWCEGSGVALPRDHDAQARWRAEAGTAASEPDPAA